MDAELSALVKQFQTLQQAEVPNQISERNAVEIANELIKKKLIELLYTTDAKEYLTWDELKREIVDEVTASGGRLNVVELPGLLTVHAFQVERVLPSILEEDLSIRLVGGELMTDQYLDSTVCSAADTLREVGSLTITQFATMHRLSSAFAQEVLENALRSGKMQAVVQDSALYTTRFVRSQTVVMRAGLLAATRPVDLQDFFFRHTLFSPLLPSLVEAVRAELPGSFEGTQLYVPAVYDRERTAQVQNIYASNGFVEYAVLQKMGIGNPRQYMMKQFNAPTTDTEESSRQQQQHQSAPAPRRGRKKAGQTSSSVTAQAVGGGSQRQQQAVVRASEEFPLCGYALGKCFLADRHLATLSALQTLMDGDVLAVDLAECLPLSVSAEMDWPVLLQRVHELYPGIEGCNLIQDSVLVRADAKEKLTSKLSEALTTALSSSSGGSGEQRAAEAKKGKRQAQEGGGSFASSTDAVVLDVLAEGLDLPLERYEDVLREVASAWEDVIAAVERKAMAARSRNAGAQLKHSRVELQSEMASAWIELVISAKGVAWAKDALPEAAHAALCRHVLSTRGYDLVRNVLMNEGLDSSELHAKVSAALEEVTSVSGLRKALVPFSERARESLAPLCDSGNGKSLDDFLETLRGASTTGTIAVSSFYSPNKKTERETCIKMKEAVYAEVAGATFGGDAGASSNLFARICTLLLHALCRVHVEVPGKAVKAVVAHLISLEGCPAMLSTANDAVVTVLQGGKMDEATCSVLEELREAALGLLQ